MTLQGKAFRVYLFTVFGLAGCHHPIYVAPAVNLPVLRISVPPPSHHTEPLLLMEVETLPPLTLQLPRQPLPKFRPRSTTARQLALLLPPALPALPLGELSTGGESTDYELRQQTEALLRDQQQRLQKLPHDTTVLHTRQVEQAHLFMREALAAWQNRDIEGTRILAMKTKLLLDEF